MDPGKYTAGGLYRTVVTMNRAWVEAVDRAWVSAGQGLGACVKEKTAVTVANL